MGKVQERPLSGVDQSDQASLLATLQLNFEQLFQDAHEHMVRESAPTSSDGSVGDMVMVDDGTDVYIAVKTSRGWFKTANLTAV